MGDFCYLSFSLPDISSCFAAQNFCRFPSQMMMKSKRKNGPISEKKLLAAAEMSKVPDAFVQGKTKKNVFATLLSARRKTKRSQRFLFQRRNCFRSGDQDAVSCLLLSFSFCWGIFGLLFNSIRSMPALLAGIEAFGCISARTNTNNGWR
jgi:hypothetical protein